MKLKQSEQTLVTLANATQLVRNIAQGVLGNDIASTFAGSDITRQVIDNNAQSHFQAAVAPYTGN